MEGSTFLPWPAVTLVTLLMAPAQGVWQEGVSRPSAPRSPLRPSKGKCLPLRAESRGVLGAIVTEGGAGMGGQGTVRPARPGEGWAHKRLGSGWGVLALRAGQEEGSWGLLCEPAAPACVRPSCLPAAPPGYSDSVSRSTRSVWCGLWCVVCSVAWHACTCVHVWFLCVA